MFSILVTLILAVTAKQLEGLEDILTKIESRRLEAQRRQAGQGCDEMDGDCGSGGGDGEGEDGQEEEETDDPVLEKMEKPDVDCNDPDWEDSELCEDRRRKGGPVFDEPEEDDIDCNDPLNAEEEVCLDRRRLDKA